MNFQRFRPFRAALSLSVLALVALLLAACGGGGSSKDAKAEISKAFSTPIKSANVTLQLNAKVNGVSQLQQPISLKVAGPYQSNGKTKLPNLDWQASFSGGGQSVSGSLISTGDNLFVGFQGTNYQFGTARVAQINQQLATQTGSKKSLKDFGIDPTSWVTSASDKGDETVNGANVDHVQAGLDVSKMLNDLNKVVQQAGNVTGAPQQLTPQQISQVQQVVKNPKFDVYVSKDDGTLRRLNVSIDFSVPAAERAQVQGAQDGNLTFSLDFADVGQPQHVTAPSNAKPISELQGALGGLGGGGTSGGSGSLGGSGGSGGSGSGGSGGGNPSPAQLKKYSACIEKADPSNTASIQKCAAILK